MSIAEATITRLTTKSQNRSVKATPSEPYVSDARSILPAMNSTVPRWINWIPSAKSSAPGTSALQSASPCGSRYARPSQIAANAANAAMLMSSPPEPSSARALPAAAITMAKAAMASEQRERGGQRAAHAAHAALPRQTVDRADRAGRGDRRPQQRDEGEEPHRPAGPGDSFADSPMDSSSAGAIPSASPASFRRAAVERRRVTQQHGEEQRERQQRAEEPECERAGEQPTAVAVVVPDRHDRMHIAGRPRCDRQRALARALRP